MTVTSLSHVRLFVTPWTAAYQAPPPMGFSRLEYWSGVPLPSPGQFPDQGSNPCPCIGRQILNHWTTREAPEGKLFRKHKEAIIGLPVVLFCVNITNINLDSTARSSCKSEKVKVTQSTLCDCMGYTVHGILQASILEWVAFPFSRVSSQPRDRTLVSCIAGGFFTS